MSRGRPLTQASLIRVMTSSTWPVGSFELDMGISFDHPRAARPSGQISP